MQDSMLGTMLSTGDRREGRTGPAGHHESQRPVRDTDVINTRTRLY